MGLLANAKDPVKTCKQCDTIHCAMVVSLLTQIIHLEMREKQHEKDTDAHAIFFLSLSQFLQLKKIKKKKYKQNCSRKIAITLSKPCTVPFRICLLITMYSVWCVVAVLLWSLIDFYSKFIIHLLWKYKCSSYTWNENERIHCIQHSTQTYTFIDLQIHHIRT